MGHIGLMSDFLSDFLSEFIWQSRLKRPAYLLKPYALRL